MSNKESGSALDSLISAALQKHDPDGFSPTMQDIVSSSNYEKRGEERGLINEKTGSSVVVRENGQINLSAGHYAQYKINPSGKSIEQTLESSIITNRRRMTIDELVVNDHKFNPQLWELTDFKKINLPTNEATIVGNLCMSGTVLTKSWDFNLKRYVLIRRPWRGPVFSNLLNVPTIKSSMHIYDPLQVDDEILANSDKGYHVNALISDAKSLVGKPGQDREGIDRDFKKVFGNVKSKNQKDKMDISHVGPAPGKGVENIPKDAESWTVDMAEACSKLCGIPADWLWCHWKAETGFVADNCPAEHNWGCVKDKNGWHASADDDEWAHFFAWYITLDTWNPQPTAAKSLLEYVTNMQEQVDGSHYCYDDGGATAPYYNKLVQCLGNEGTVLS